MNILKTIAAAGLLLSTATIATSADAQGRHGDRYGHHDRDRGRGWGHGYDRGRHYGWDRGRGWGGGYHRRCWTEWRWHHRVRICR